MRTSMTLSNLRAVVRAATTSAGEPGRRIAAALAFAGLAAGVIGIGISSPAEGARAKVLGKPKSAPKPECPGNDCVAFVKSTGFQIKAKGKKQIFRARENGKIVAFAVDLARPNKQERNFFGNNFPANSVGKKPAVRVAVLKPIGNNRYRLMRQSPTVKVGNLLGREQFFTLNDPLRIRKGNILALTVPSWLPALATGLPPKRTAWRASRRKGKCKSLNDVKKGTPHRKVGSERKYACRYNLDRLLYWGYYVPN